MTSKSRPRPQDECVGVGTALGTDPARPRKSTLKPNKAGRSRLASRVTAGLRRRMPSFKRTGTDDTDDLSDDEGPAASAPVAPPFVAMTVPPAGRGDGRPSPLHEHGDPLGAPYAAPFPSPSNLDDVDGDRGDAGGLAREVGRNAQEYLDECFCSEGSAVARETFEAIPQIRVADLNIMDHIGKGSFCDVCTVVCKAGSAQTLAMKRLRRQVCATEDLFAIGAEDLVHETAVLAGLVHPHIIQLHGRSTGSVAEAFARPGGYFVLLEHLAETLPDRLDAWRRPGAVRGGRLAVARPVADAAAYLHSRAVVFRDLKPDNVGFDHKGRVKLFDFGFATGLPSPDESADGLLYDRCGTPRYMAPEVGLSRGYGTEADVYSFGILLWEMCALAKPFANITKAEEFERVVFREGQRLELSKEWPSAVKRLIRSCWSANPSTRPTMAEVKSSLSMAMASSDF